ncbi:hypothetical protein ACWD26_02140 [Streptomyces sp. NPDC002787]
MLRRTTGCRSAGIGPEDPRHPRVHPRPCRAGVDHISAPPELCDASSTGTHE